MPLICFWSEPKKGAGKLLRLNELFPFESYRSFITQAIDTYRISHGGKPTSQLSSAGRRAMDPIFMLKCVVAQHLYGKADRDFEQEMLQNRVLQHWLGIFQPGDVPSHKTIWKYKEIFAQTEVLETVFADYVKKLQSINCHIGKDAVIADSSFFEAPKQRNTREENALIKKGKGSTLWNDQPVKKRHKDIDASWTKKRKEVHYGYKGHFLLCAVSKLIVKVFPTTAKVHDAKVIDRYLHWAKDSKKEVLFFADAGYTGKKIVEKLLEANMPPLICEKGRKGVPLTADQKQSNKMISSVRSRIEHAFGFIEESLGGSVVRSIGLIRAKFNITLTSLVYNICRLGQIVQENRRVRIITSMLRTEHRYKRSRI